GGVQGGLVGRGEEGVHGGLQFPGGAQGVAEDGGGQITVVPDHGPGLGLVEGGRGRCALLAGGRRGLGGGVLVIAAAGQGDGDGDGEQARGDQGHTGHGEVL